VNLRRRNPHLLMTEEQLGECIRSLCTVYGWRFLWLRKTYNSSRGILDLLLIPLRHLDRQHMLHRELKGYDARGRLGKATPDQLATMETINAAGGDAALWLPADWHSGRIEAELK
jgi:hypothetical protein